LLGSFVGDLLLVWDLLLGSFVDGWTSFGQLASLDYLAKLEDGLDPTIDYFRKLLAE